MITHVQGDILNDQSEAVVNTVNCVGVMGRGVALQFRNAYPDNYKAYQKACRNGEVRPGAMFVHETGNLTGPRYIINFPTKRHWRGNSRMEDIESGLHSLVEWLSKLQVRSVALPPLGCGLGGLDWNDVRPRIEQALSKEKVEVKLYEPAGAPPAPQMVRNRTVPSMTSGRTALVQLINHYLRGLLDPVVTLLEVHKLMYFLQEAGEPLKLNYARATYGPFAENLRHVMKKIEGHMISGYADGGDAPDKQIELLEGVSEEARRALEANAPTQQNLNRVLELVEGFESSAGLELLSTVHWVAKEEAPQTLEALITGVHAWGERKKQFTPRQITLAAKTLMDKGWLSKVLLAA
jgi:O-acetyl-ADP-ribose deacetylase (regulator of RNase III)